MKFTRKDYSDRIVDKANKIPEDEPVFLLRAQDIHSTDTLRFYAAKVEKHNPKMAEELRKHAKDMLLWRLSVKSKEPDVPFDENQK